MSLLPEIGLAFCSVLAESAPLVVLGFIVAGLLHEFVPSSELQRGVGGRTLAPVLRVVGIGTLLPICSCSTIPLGVGLTRCGASTGTALAFMTSSPAVSPVSLILGWCVLGPTFIGWYATLAVGGAIAIGVLGNQLLSDVNNPESKPKSCGCDCGCESSGGSRLLRALRWSLAELGVEVSQSLVMGLAVASLVLVAIPEGLVEGWLSEPSWLALLAAVAVALPAYTCSVPSLVIAGSLIARGVDPGVAVVFLIAGPATNLGELNAIRSAMGAKAAVFYAVMLIAIALAAGMLTSLLPLPVAADLTGHAGHDHTHAIDSAVFGSQASADVAPSLGSILTWRLPFAVLVVVLAVVSLFRTLRSKAAVSHTPASNKPASDLLSITSR